MFTAANKYKLETHERGTMERPGKVSGSLQEAYERNTLVLFSAHALS